MWRNQGEIFMEDSINTAKEPSAKTLDPDRELPPSWVCVAVVVALALVLLAGPLGLIGLLLETGDLDSITKAHASAMIGIPWAGGAAFIVVLVLRTSFGAINFKVLGVEFKGASGPIVVWVLCFLVEVSAIKLLW
jgi:hypothetical protein